MFLGSIEQGGGEGEVVTEAVTGVVIVAEGGTVPTGVTVDGTFKATVHNTVCTLSHWMLTVAEDVVTNPWSLKKAVVSRLRFQLYIFSPLMNATFFSLSTRYILLCKCTFDIVLGKPNFSLPDPAIAVQLKVTFTRHPTTHRFNENVHKTTACGHRCLEVCIATDARHIHQKLPIFPSCYNTPRPRRFTPARHSSGQGTHGLPPADAPVHRKANPH